MNTLFHDITRLLERTYASAGVALEDCIIHDERCRQLSLLAGAQARELSQLARTFLRHSGANLFIGIYYSRWLIDHLEAHDPRRGLSDRNIGSLISFVEEIDHALHAALAFRRGVRDVGSEDFIRNLELQSRVDTYMVLLLFVGFFRKTQRVARTDRRWLRFHLFQRESANYTDDMIRARYMETAALGEAYTKLLDTLNAARRVDEIRVFHSLDYTQKKERILQLAGRPQLLQLPAKAAE